MKDCKASKKNHPATSAAPIPSRPGRRRLWAFRLIALILIPVLFLGILEGSLRVFGFGYPTGTFVKDTLGDKEIYRQNYQFGWRFFPRNIARTFDGFVLDAQKPPRTYRIFILGASAAMGMPAPAYNFGRILEAMLNDIYPDMTFEVYTTAMVAINSHAVLEIAKDCAKHEPDLFIVYLGNNEVVGPFGPGTIFSPLSPHLSLIRANLAVKSTRTGQLFEQLLSPSVFHANTPERWGGLEMFLEKQVRHDSPALHHVYHHFETNLQDICRVAHRAGAAVIISNVGSNLKDCPPFASLHRADLTDSEKQQWEQLYRQGIDFETDGQYQPAVDRYRAAAETDDTYADLHFRTGRCCWKLGKYQQARQEYIKARDYDTLRFRADTQINEIIHKIAANRQQEGIYFIDSITALQENSPHQTPGAELFYEHVHFNFSGNYIIASAVFPAVQKLLPSTLQATSASFLTERQAAGRLAYTDNERNEYMKQIFYKMLDEPPFTNQLYHQEMMETDRQQLNDLEAALEKKNPKDYLPIYENAVQKHPDDWHLAWQYSLFLENKLNDRKAQQAQLRKVIALCPYDRAYLALGTVLHQEGNIKEAKEYLDKLLELNPASGRAHVELASIYRQLRDYDKYIEHLSASLSIDPKSSIQAYGALAEAYEKTGQIKKAIDTLYQAVRYFPESETAPAHASLGYMLNAEGEYEKAFAEFKLALKINPDFANDALFTSLMKHLETKTNHDVNSDP
jgi:tetratricopeptide (TPR) repeat protein